MAEKLVGTAVTGGTIAEIQAKIQRAEELGIHAAWMTTGGASLDSLTCFAASAAGTTSIKLGTSIVPTSPPGCRAAGPSGGPTRAGASPPGRGAKPPAIDGVHGYQLPRPVSPPPGISPDSQSPTPDRIGRLRRRALLGPRFHRRAAGCPGDGFGAPERFF